jgi:hypothetical protein
LPILLARLTGTAVVFKSEDRLLSRSATRRQAVWGLVYLRIPVRESEVPLIWPKMMYFLTRSP